MKNSNYKSFISLTLIVSIISAVLCGCAVQALENNVSAGAESNINSEEVAITENTESNIGSENSECSEILSSVDGFTTTSRSELPASRDTETELRDLEELINRFKDREEIYYYELSRADIELMCKYYENPEIEKLNSKIKQDGIGLIEEED